MTDLEKAFETLRVCVEHMNTDHARAAYLLIQQEMERLREERDEARNEEAASATGWIRDRRALTETRDQLEKAEQATFVAGLRADGNSKYVASLANQLEKAEAALEQARLLTENHVQTPELLIPMIRTALDRGTEMEKQFPDGMTESDR